MLDSKPSSGVPADREGWRDRGHRRSRDSSAVTSSTCCGATGTSAFLRLAVQRSTSPVSPKPSAFLRMLAPRSSSMQPQKSEGSAPTPNAQAVSSTPTQRWASMSLNPRASTGARSWCTLVPSPPTRPMPRFRSLRTTCSMGDLLRPATPMAWLSDRSSRCSMDTGGNTDSSRATCF